eukprot:scaffold521_cov167-Amphora_coffeaeformis.AAC.33
MSLSTVSAAAMVDPRCRGIFLHVNFSKNHRVPNDTGLYFLSLPSKRVSAFNAHFTRGNEMIPRHGSVSIFLTGLSTFDTRSFGDFAKTTTTPTRVSTFDTSTSTRVCPFNKRSTGGNDSLQDGTFYTDEDVP